MRSLFLWLLLATPALSRAQAAAPPATTPAVATQYCTLVAVGSTYSGMQLQLDYGRQVKKYLSAPEAAEAKADQVALDNIFTIADALNFLSSHGWECIGVSSVTSSLSGPPTTGFVPRAGNTLAVGHSEVQYLLRRRGQ
ncbi:MAG: hypothetical protein ACRYG7_10215 [Janthinobacterium lividum]